MPTLNKKQNLLSNPFVMTLVALMEKIPVVIQHDALDGGRANVNAYSHMMLPYLILLM